MRLGTQWTEDEPIIIPDLSDKTRIYFVNECFLRKIPSSIFQRYPNLEAAHFHCAIVSLSPGDFEGAKNLSQLEIDGNLIHQIRRGTFEHLGKVSSLRLTSNSISDIEGYAFEGMAELTYVNLDGNELTTLRKDAFSGVPKVRSIHLQNNKLSSIEEGALDVPELRSLILLHNQLSTLPNKLFESTESLRSLYLTDNKFEDIPAALSELSASLEELVVDENPLRRLNLRDLQQITSLNTVSLVGSQVTLPEKVDGTNVAAQSNLYEIKLTGRNLTSAVLEHLSAFPNLKHISIGPNLTIGLIKGIDNIKGMFPNLEQLEITGEETGCSWLELTMPNLKIASTHTWPEGFKCIISF